MNQGAEGITLSKVLSSLSKTLGVANQIIPLWEQSKPIFKNVRSAYNLLSGINLTSLPNLTSLSLKKNKETAKISGDINNEINIKKRVTSNPQFFI